MACRCRLPLLLILWAFWSCYTFYTSANICKISENNVLLYIFVLVIVICFGVAIA